jgi:MoaA/NifB/PqqE/SkfB family radical SAM enzyme
MIVVWRVTEHCNLACKFCAYDRDLVRSRRDAEPEEIYGFAAVLRDYQAETGDRVLVSWLGGEPLLWRPLRTLSESINLEFGLRLSTTTNGTPLGSPAVRAHLLRSYAELTVSADALGQTHDQLRGSIGLFASLQRNVRLLSAEKRQSGSALRLRANVVLMKQTLPDFPALCQELASWGIEEICFNQLGGNDRPEFYSGHRLSPAQTDELAELLPVLRAQLAQVGVRLLGSRAYLQRMHASARDDRLAIAHCHPGESFLFIDETGRVAPCSFTNANYGVNVKSLTTVRDLIHLPQVFTERRQHQRASACDDCLSTHVFAKFDS